MSIFRFNNWHAISATAKRLDYPVKPCPQSMGVEDWGARYLLVTIPREDVPPFEELAAELHRSYSNAPACFDGVYVGEE